MSSSLYVCWPQIIDHFCSHHRLLLFCVMWDGGCSYFLHTIHKSLVLSQKLLEAIVVVRVAVIISEWSLEKTIPEWRIGRQSNSAILWRRTKTRKWLYQFKSIKCAAGKTVVWMLFSISDLYFCLDYFPVTMLSCYCLTRQDLLVYCCITSTGEHHSRPFLYIHFKWASNYDKSLPKLGLRWSGTPGDSES